jgi:transcriptional regulator of acetoin/glycerol metabolism
VILANDGVLPNPLPTIGTEVMTVPSSQTTLKDSERALIVSTLESLNWLIGGPTGAAAKLGLKRTTLISKMKKLGISRPPRQSNADSLDKDAPQSRPSSLIQ